MARKLMASDRKSLIRLASSLPVGSEDRRTILSALKKARTFNPYRTGHKYGIDLKTVDNKTVKRYGSDGNATSGLSGLFYATGTVTDSSRPGEHPFMAVFRIDQSPRSGTMIFDVERVYGRSAEAAMNAEIASYVFFQNSRAASKLVDMLGRIQYVPAPGTERDFMD